MEKKKRGKLDIYSHFLKFREFDDQTRVAFRFFLRQKLIAKELVKENGRWVKRDGKVYCFIPSDKLEIRFHINVMQDLRNHCNMMGINIDNDFEKTVHGFTKYKEFPAAIKVQSKFVPYDYQQETIEYILEEGHRKIVNILTGGGKGLCSWKSAELLGVRTCVCVLPKYKDKWVEDAQGYLESINGDAELGNSTLVISTIDKFLTALKYGVDESVGLIILTLTTIRSYIERFKEFPKDFDPPETIWEKLGVGFRITDETHEHFHLNYMIDLVTHCPKTLYLSATLDPSGTFVDKMYRTMFPVHERQGGSRVTRYINVIAATYTHSDPMKMRCQLQGRYSHVAYEANFTSGRHSDLMRQQYFKMINDLLDVYYLQKRKPGQKAIIFFSTIKMCTMFADYLKSKYPDIDTRRYVGEDDYDEVQSGEIIVSTIGSAGTAIDIPGLITNIMTMSIESRQQNLQVMGRLRELKKWPGQHPYFIYLVGEDMGKPWDYHEKKKSLLKDRVLSHELLDTQVCIMK